MALYKLKLRLYNQINNPPLLEATNTGTTSYSAIIGNISYGMDPGRVNNTNANSIVAFVGTSILVALNTEGYDGKARGIYINKQGYPEYIFWNCSDYSTYEITCSDTIAPAGIGSLSVTADSGINHILYNNMTYDTFPATIPLDPAANTMQVESKSPVVTINDGGNLKSVTYGSATYTKFPATVTATAPEFEVTARGKDSPVITVRTERTQTPVITNT